tara:strand:+ start:16097 stop:16285 length:189 start_codon:yes stop_codon:yes gene_type:complete
MSNFILEKTLGLTAISVMDDCYKFGLMNGCAVDCPQLIRGECELMENENKELYEQSQLDKQA